MIKNVLVVGFGNMGCRHVQALLQDKKKYIVHIVEPLEENIENNIPRIGASKSDCFWYQKISDLPLIDLAVVATSSAPRYEIVKQLLEMGVKYFLLEKIVFQSVDQFNTILELTKKMEAKIYCNFVNRYFPAYREIQESISASNSVTEFTLYGNAFGIGCNAIHYIDILQFITNNNEIRIEQAKIVQLDQENKRGNQYQEFSGTLKIINSKGDSLNIISDKEFGGGVSIHIKNNINQWLLSEQTQQFFKIEKDGITAHKFLMPPTSKLTDVLTDQILEGTCTLTLLENTFTSHKELFNVINMNLYGTTNNSTLCPIT